MNLMRLALLSLLALPLSSTASAQPAVHVDGDDITMRGCVTPAGAQLEMPFETLLWSRGGILTAGTAAASDVPVRAATRDLANRVLYWVDGDDLKDHAGQMVEVRGEVEELKTGEIEIERDGDFTEIRLEIGGNEDEIRVPTAWLERGSVARAAGGDRLDDDLELEIATRKIDVDEVKVLGRCPAP